MATGDVASRVEVLAFDIFGTFVDRHGSIVNAVQASYLRCVLRLAGSSSANTIALVGFSMPPPSELAAVLPVEALLLMLLTFTFAASLLIGPV